MSKGMLSSPLFDSRVPEDKITGKEKLLGYFMGPIAVMVMNAILSTYLNVYYTDVLNISGIWGGMFISLFPIVAKLLDVLMIYLVVINLVNALFGAGHPYHRLDSFQFHGFEYAGRRVG